MRVIPALDLSLLSSNVSGASEPDWDSGTTYASGDRVVYENIIYEATASTAGDVPPDTPSKWVRVGPTNRWAMFSGSSQSATQNSTSIDVTVGVPDFADRVALFGLVADSVQVVVRSGTTVISDETYSSPGRSLVAIISGLYPSLEIDLTITATEAECQQIVVGKSRYIGLGQWEYSPGIVDFSRKSTNDFGETTLVQRSFARTLDVSSFIDPGIIDAVNREFTRLRATPAVWDANNNGSDRDDLRVFGWLEDSSIKYRSYNHATADIRIQEMT